MNIDKNEIQNTCIDMDGDEIFHGYQQWHLYESLWVRGKFNFDNEIGYCEDHLKKETSFYIR